MLKLRLAVITVFCVSISAFSQSADNTVNQSLEWFSINSTMKVHPRINIYGEINLRFVREEAQQHQARTAVEFVVFKNLIVTPLGYVYTWNYSYGKQPAAFANNEHRMYQQIVFKHAAGRFNFQHRARLEERFLQTHHLSSEGVTVGDEYNDKRERFRYRALITIPLNHEKIEPNTVFLSLSDEIFASWGKNVTYHSPDQNRIFVGAGYQFNKHASLQAGAMYQMLKKANGLQQENNIGVSAQFTYNLDFTREVKN
ncbi:MAG: DUF2490 domain-containing protein [Cyclobacteriaceae bacterium]